MISITFDVEPDLHTEDYNGISEGIPRIIEVLNNHSIKATFFTTCDCIQHNLKIFQKLIKQGHEIALHGYRHERFDDLLLEEKNNNIRNAVNFFKKHLGIIPVGFRSPQHSIDSSVFNILKERGVRYDSSLTPINLMQFIFFPKRIKSNLKSFFSNPRKHEVQGITEIPVTSLLIPFVSLFVRILPSFLIKFYFNVISYLFGDIVFYAHSWDFIEIKNSRIDKAVSHSKFIERFDLLLSYISKKNKFVKMEELYEKYKNS